MKNIFFSFAFLLILSTPVFAQDYNPPQTIDLSEINKKINEDDLFGIRIGEPQFEDKVYNQKDVVIVTLPLNNNTNIDYSDISISAYILTHELGKAPQNYGYKNNLVQVFLSKKTKKDVTLQFQMPDSVTFKPEYATRLEFIALTKSGEMLGVSGKNIKLGSFLESININNAYLKVNEKEYGLQNGPTISATTSPQLAVEFKNETSEDITLNPKLKVYDIVPSKPEVGSKDYDSFTVKAGETKELILDLPVFSKGGVYDGQMNFVDNEGNERAPFVSSRWIVEGDMATISNVNINKDSFKKGEQAIVTVEYTGSPINFETGESMQTGAGMMKIVLFNEKKEVIAEGQQEINLSKISDVATFEIPVSQNASNVSIEVVITKGEVELIRYSTNLTDPDASKDSGFVMYMILGLMVILIVLALVFVKKKYIPTVVIVFTMFLGFSGIFGVGVVSAQQAEDLMPPSCIGSNCYTRWFSVIASIDKFSFVPGEEMGYSIRISPTAEVCLNNYFSSNVSYGIYNSDGNLINTYNTKNLTYPGSGHLTTWQPLPSFSPMSSNQVGSSIPAPIAPGSYYLRIDSNIDWWRSGENITYGSGYLCTLKMIESIFRPGSQTWQHPTIIDGKAFWCPIRATYTPSPIVHWIEFEVTADPNIPTTPTLNAFADTVSTSSAKINWIYNDVKDQIGYKIEISRDSGFGNIEQNFEAQPIAFESNIVNKIASVLFKYNPFSLIVNAQTPIKDVRERMFYGLTPNADYHARVTVDNGEVLTVATTTFKTLLEENIFSVSCSAVPINPSVGDTTIFTATPNNPSPGPVTYSWREEGVALSGNGPTIQLSKSSAGSYGVEVLATDSSNRQSASTCAVQFIESSVESGCLGPKPTLFPGVCYKCNEIKHKWERDTGSTDPVCGGGGGNSSDPELKNFKITPNYVDPDIKCGLQLNVIKTSGCILENVNNPVSGSVSISTNLPNEINDTYSSKLPVGTYKLKCKGTGTKVNVEKTFDTKACYSNPGTIQI